MNGVYTQAILRRRRQMQAPVAVDVNLGGLRDLNGTYHFVSDESDIMHPVKRPRTDDDPFLGMGSTDPIPLNNPLNEPSFLSSHASSGVRIMPSADIGELWLEAVHDKISYDRDDAILPILAYEDILVGEIDLRRIVNKVSESISRQIVIGKEGGSLQIPLHIYDERGRMMTWGMYKNRWYVINRAIAQDPILNANLLVCEYVQLNEISVKETVFAYLEEEMNERRIIPLANTIKAGIRIGNLQKRIPTASQNLAHVVKVVEGFYVMKNRPVGDISKAVHASYAGMLWKIQGYRRLTNRFIAEMQNLEQELKRRQVANDMDAILQNSALVIPLARLLDTMLVYRYTSHITPSDQKEIDRVTDAYESMFQSFLASLKTPF